MTKSRKVCFDIEETSGLPVVTATGRYFITEDGEVISKGRLKSGNNMNGPFSFYTQDKKLKVQINVSGYEVITLTDCHGKNRTYLIHRLVAMAFVPNLDNKPQVNHIDGNKTNNTAANLEWVTSQENVLHSYITGLASNSEEKHPRSVLTVEDVFKIAELFIKGVPCIEMVSIIGKKYHTIYKVLEGKNWQKSFREAIDKLKVLDNKRAEL